MNSSDLITEKQLKKDLRRFKPFWHGRCKVIQPGTYHADMCGNNNMKGRGYMGVHPVVSLNHKRGGVADVY